VTLKCKLYQYSHYRYLPTKLTTFAIETKSHVISEFILIAHLVIRRNSVHAVFWQNI